MAPLTSARSLHKNQTGLTTSSDTKRWLWFRLGQALMRSLTQNDADVVFCLSGQIRNPVRAALPHCPLDSSWTGIVGGQGFRVVANVLMMDILRHQASSARERLDRVPGVHAKLTCSRWYKLCN